MRSNNIAVFNRGSPVFSNNSNSGSLTDLVKKSQAILLKIKNLFPFDLFPDSLIVDENKVSIIHRGLWSEHVHGILIEDITSVDVGTNIFFATLHITDSNNPRFPENFFIHYLKKNEAMCARRIIQGMMEAKRMGIEIKPDQCVDETKQIENIGLASGE